MLINDDLRRWLFRFPTEECTFLVNQEACLGWETSLNTKTQKKKFVFIGWFAEGYASISLKS